MATTVTLPNAGNLTHTITANSKMTIQNITPATTGGGNDAYITDANGANPKPLSRLTSFTVFRGQVVGVPAAGRTITFTYQ